MTAEINVPGDFDLDDDFSGGQGEHGNLADLANVMGWDTWGDVVRDNTDLDPTDIRPGVYAYAEDAIWDAFEVGIIEYISIYWDGEHWHLVVEYPEP